MAGLPVDSLHGVRRQTPPQVGVAKNSRLEKALAKKMEQARRGFLRSGHAARCFADLRYRTHKTWSRSRRVVGKLFKIGALISVSVRRLYVRLSSAFPRKQILTTALTRLGVPSG